jgi:hypothetical protein
LDFDSQAKTEKYRPDLSERMLHINKPETVIIKERMGKIGRGSQMGAFTKINRLPETEKCLWN